MRVVVREATPAEVAAAKLQLPLFPCKVGAPLLEGLSETPVDELPPEVREEHRERGLLWRLHFLACGECYDVWAREALKRGAVVLSPTRPLPVN